MTDQTRRRFIQLGSGVLILGAVGGAAADSHDDDEETDDHEDGDEYDDGEDHEDDEGDEDHDDDEEMEDDEDHDEDAESAFVRVGHLSPDAPNVDVWIDGEPTIEDLPFGEVTDYLELPAGSYGVEITAAGNPETSVFDEELEVPAGDFTVAAIGELEGDREFEVTVLEDDRTEPAEGEARVAAFHASPDAPNVDIRVAATGDALFEDVPFGAGGAVDVPEGEYRLCVYPAGDDGAVLGVDVELEAGTVYSAFAVGYVGDEPALDVALAAADARM